jgi:hypothetical protein
VVACLIELSCITAKYCRVDPELILSSTDHNAGNQLFAEEADRLTQRPTGMVLVQVGPKEGHQAVAPAELSRGGQGKIHQERQALRLSQEGS